MRIRRRYALPAAAGVVMGLLSLGSPAGAASSPSVAVTATTPTKVLLYGDSITMGAAAHYTWRYRLWAGLQAAGTDAEFVGPLHTVFAYPSFWMGSMEYRNPNFDTAHAAVAGMTLTDPVWTIASLAATYQPDVIVGLIGYNDLRTGVATPQHLADTWSEQIQQARAVDPGVSVVLAEYGEVWAPGISEYDQDLSALAAQLDEPDARVVATSVPQLNYWTDTFDGAHLTTNGEKVEAASVADALDQLGLASAAAPSDPPDTDGQFAPAPQANASSSGIVLTWPSVDYASSEDVWAQDVASGRYAEMTFVPGNSVSIGGVPGHTYRIWLFPVQGWAQIGTYSMPITVTVPPVS